MRVKIAGLGDSFPDRIVENDEIGKHLGSDSSWIFQATGIKQRRMLSKGENISDFATVAAQRALSHAKVDISEVDLIIACSNSPDKWMPALATTIHKKIGAKHGVPAFDIVAACAGWMIGLKIGAQNVQLGESKNCLVIGADAMSRSLDPKDRNCVLFGDGAGACLLRATPLDEEGGIRRIKVFSDGTYGEILQQPGGGSANPPSQDMVDKGLQFLRMDGEKVFYHAVKCFVSACKTVLEEEGLTIHDIDWFVPHQANKNILDVVAQKLGLPPEKVATNIEIYGNTTAATVPTCLSQYVNGGKILPGQKVLIATFGGGLTWSAGILEV